MFLRLIHPSNSTRTNPAWGTAEGAGSGITSSAAANPLHSSEAYLPEAIASSEVLLGAVQERSLSPSRFLFASDTGADLKAPRLQWLSDCGIHYHQKESLHQNTIWSWNAHLQNASV